MKTKYFMVKGYGQQGNLQGIVKAVINNYSNSLHELEKKVCCSWNDLNLDLSILPLNSSIQDSKSEIW